MISPHRKSDAQDDLEGVLLVSMDFRFLGEKEPEEQVTQMTGAMLVPKKGTELPWRAKRAAKFSDQLGHNRVPLRCDSELEVEALARELTQARQEGCQTVPERPPVGESQSNGIIEGTLSLSGTGLFQNTESCVGASHWHQGLARCEDTVLAGGVRRVPDEQVRHW